MSPARAWPAVALAVAALAAAASAAPAAPVADQPVQPTAALDTIDNTNAPVEEEIKYPEGSSGPERPGWGAGSSRLFSQLVAPLLQLALNQLLQATNLVGALASAGRPNAVLTLFARVLAASTGGPGYPGQIGAPAGL